MQRPYRKPPFQYGLGGLMLTISTLAALIWSTIYVTPMVVPFAAFVTLVLVWGVLAR